MQESEYLKFLVSSGAPVLWCPPVTDGDGNWLPEVDGEGTGTAGSGYWLPHHKDPVVREKHRIREAEDVDYFLAKEPRPAFILLTGHVFDVVDVDVREADEEHQELQREARLRMQETCRAAGIATIATPSGGTHWLVPSDETLHSTSNTHTRIDYRGRGGIAWLPGTRKRVGKYHVVACSGRIGGSCDLSIGLLLAEFRQAFKDCVACKKQQQERAQLLYSGLRLGEGAGWDGIEEDLPVVDWTDPLTDTHPKAVANATMTWRELLSPWFDVIGVRDSIVWLMRAGKVQEGRQGKSAILDLATNTCTIWSSDWPIATGVQLGKLDVYAAIKEFETPGNAPEDFAEQMQYLRDRWGGEVVASVGVAVPDRLRMQAANHAKLPVGFPVLPDEFWEMDPLLKRIYQDSDVRRASPEGVLSSILCYTISHIGHQVRIPGLFSDEARAGATLNMGQIKVGEPGAGKGQGEKIAAMFVEPYCLKKFASGQAFPKAYGRMIKPSKPTAAELAADPFLDPNPLPYYERTNWSVYTEYAELDEFKAQAASDTSTLSSILRDVTTSDVLSERVAVSEQSNSGEVIGFRFCFTAHAQPLKLEWLIEQSSNGFPQRFWWIWSKPRPKSREELLALPRVAPPIVPLNLQIPAGWEMQEHGDADKPMVLVPLPDCATEDVILWEYDCPGDDVRGMLCVRLKAYSALKVLLPEMDECDVWKLATMFHTYSREVRLHVEEGLRAEKAKASAVVRKMAQETAVAVTEATEAKRQTLMYAKCRARVVSIFAEKRAATRRELTRRLSASQKEMLDEVMEDLSAEGTLRATATGWELR